MENQSDISVEQIEQGIEFIRNSYEYYNEYNLTIDKENEEVYMGYPASEENFSYNDFDFLVSELHNFKIINEGRFQTTWTSYQIVKFENEDIQGFLLSKTFFVKEFALGVLKIVDDVDFLKFVSIELNAYDDEFGTFHRHYPVVEIHYHDKRSKLSVEDENKMILSYLFEICDSTGYNISLDKFFIPSADFYSNIKISFLEADPPINEISYKLKPLIAYNEGMNLYVSAVQVNDEGLKFLNFYKIIEYFAPIIISLEGNSLLVSKLESPKVLNPDKDYIDEIFELVNTIKDNQRDSELGKIVLKQIDMVDSFNLLPERLKKHSKNIAKIDELNYKTSKDKLSIAINVISTALYSTRNMVVHAKSNFQPTGDEAQPEEINQLNIFMRYVTAKLIRWYNKLPKHQK